MLHPFIAPRICSCGGYIVPAGFHLLVCKHKSYICIHDRVKLAVVARIRSFVSAAIAPSFMMLEQPMELHFGPRNEAAADSSDSLLIAD